MKHFRVCFNDMLHLQSDNVMSRQQDAARTPNVLRENAASRAYNATNLLNYEPGRVRWIISHHPGPNIDNAIICIFRAGFMHVWIGCNFASKIMIHSKNVHRQNRCQKMGGSRSDCRLFSAQPRAAVAYNASKVHSFHPYLACFARCCQNALSACNEPP